MRWAIGMVLLVTMASTRAAGPAPEYELQASGEIVVDVDGGVRSYTLDTGLPDSIEGAVRRNIEAWRFDPVVQDGRPVAGRTRMSLAIELVPRDNGDLLLRVRDVWFGGPATDGRNQPPQYPGSAIRNELGARVMLVLKLDPAGRVVDVHPYQTSLSKRVGSEVQARRWRREFEEASIAAARQWRYVPGEVVGGNTVGNTVMVPVVYTTRQGITRRGIDNVWRSYLPGPVSPAPWVDASSLAGLDTDALGDGQAAPLHSAFRLRDDIVGKVL